jgi:hypothetical protein
MKTIVFNETNESMYNFEDGVELTVTPDNIITPDFYIGHMRESNSKVYENVTPPADWQPCKYFFDGTEWTANPVWVDAKLAEIARLEEELAALKP